MKNDKICINKSIALAVVALVLVVGALAFANAIRLQRTTQSAKAAGSTPQLVKLEDRSIFCPKDIIEFNVTKDTKANPVRLIKNTAVYTTGTEECNDPKNIKAQACQTCLDAAASPNNWEDATKEEYDMYHNGYNDQFLKALDAKNAKDAKDGVALCDDIPVIYNLTSQSYQRTGTTYDLSMVDDTATATSGKKRCTETNIENCPKICKYYDLTKEETEAVIPIFKARYDAIAGVFHAAPLTCTGKCTLYPNGQTCGCVGTVLYNAGLRNQYCGNIEYKNKNAKDYPQECKDQEAKAKITCPPEDKPLAYGMSGGACYQINGQVFNEGSTKPYCGNRKLEKTTCCDDPKASGCDDRTGKAEAVKSAPTAAAAPKQQTAPAAASAPKYGPEQANCDADWWCHGVCAEKSVRDMFGNDAAKWRKERAAAVGEC